MATVQLKGLSPATSSVDADIMHLQTSAGGVDKSITKGVLLTEVNTKLDSSVTLVKVVDGTTVKIGERILAKNLLATHTVFLPSSPSQGQWVEIGGEGLYSDHPVFVDGVTNDIMVVSDKICELDQDNIVYRFWWDSSLWKMRIASSEGRV